MSTDYQQYSTENQAIAIATYAAQRKISIVRSYKGRTTTHADLENDAKVSTPKHAEERLDISLPHTPRARRAAGQTNGASSW
jgi:hypothetical protein